jgi:hypothetical protein
MAQTFNTIWLQANAAAPGRPALYLDDPPSKRGATALLHLLTPYKVPHQECLVGEHTLTIPQTSPKPHSVDLVTDDLWFSSASIEKEVDRG